MIKRILPVALFLTLNKSTQQDPMSNELDLFLFYFNYILKGKGLVG